MGFIIIASDHGGFQLKQNIIKFLEKEHTSYTITNVGVYNEDSMDYPDICQDLIYRYNLSNLYNSRVEKKQIEGFCIVICGTGIGVSISCNKYKNIRCALCHNEYTAEMAKKHNNANVIAMGGRILNIETAINIINTFINTQYEGGRHQRRLDKISKLYSDVAIEELSNLSNQ